MRLTKNEALHRAAEHGSVELVAFLLRNGWNINGSFDDRIRGNGVYYDVFTRTPLCRAVCSANEKVVAYLLENGADADPIKYTPSKTPLQWAAEAGYTTIVNMLIEHGAYVKTRCEIRNPLLGHPPRSEVQPVHLAALNGHLDVVALLLKNGVAVDEESGKNHTPLYLAAAGGHLHLVKFLVEQAQAKINLKSSYAPDPTMLHAAFFWKHIPVARYLIQKGADVFAKDRAGWNSLHYLAHAGADAELAADLLHQGVSGVEATQKGITPIDLSAEQSNVEIIRLLLDAGADLNRRGFRGHTPLHRAAEKSQTEVIKYLTVHGASHLAEDDAGLRPVHRMVKSSDLEALRWVIENSGVPDLVYSKQSKCRYSSILHYAAALGNVKIVSYLLSAGADTNVLDVNGDTPLHVACRRKSPAIVAMLLERGANVHTPNNQEFTPLHVACARGGEQSVALLVKHGADISTRSQGGSTGLHFAARTGSKLVVSFLLRRGLDPNAMANDGLTPLCHAVQANRKEVVGMLLNHGADPTHSRHNGITPVHLAMDTNSIHASLQVARLVLKAAGLHWLDPAGPVLLSPSQRAPMPL